MVDGWLMMDALALRPSISAFYFLLCSLSGRPKCYFVTLSLPFCYSFKRTKPNIHAVCDVVTLQNGPLAGGKVESLKADAKG